MAFEVFDKRMSPLAKAPSVTIQKRGIFFNQQGSARADRGTGDGGAPVRQGDDVIALRPSTEAHAYAFRPLVA
ncbi:hypothetical protein GS426_19875 [Rhodococcus hoagii]|nr:hypothetical protein [Prescottella equi]